MQQWHEDLLEALVLAQGGWSGEENGPMHQAHKEAVQRIQSAKEVILQRKGLCPHCGGKTK